MYRKNARSRAPLCLAAVAAAAICLPNSAGASEGMLDTGVAVDGFEVPVSPHLSAGQAVDAALAVSPAVGDGLGVSPAVGDGLAVSPAVGDGLGVTPAVVSDVPAVPSTSKGQNRQPAVRTAAQRWLVYTTKSTRTRDLDGVEPSMYRGKFYRASLEDKRECIVRRESNGHYFSISRSGYRGAYQMSDALARGATWMMLDEHRTLLGDQAARELMARLRQVPANRWPRYWQDAAFSTVHNWKYAGSGASHWYGGRWHC